MLKKKWAERWVLDAGKKALSLGRYEKYIVYFALLGCASIMATLLTYRLMRINELEEAIHIAFSAATTVALILLDIQIYERRNFYLIIKEQKEKIEMLEKELQNKINQQ